MMLLPSMAGNDPKSEEQGTPLHINPAEDEDAVTTQTGTQQVRVMLPLPHIGRFTVRIRYRVPPPALASSDVEWPIPLVHAADGRSSATQATVHAPRSIAVALAANTDGSSWKTSNSANDNSTRNSAYAFAADAPELHLPLTIRAAEPIWPRPRQLIEFGCKLGSRTTLFRTVLRFVFRRLATKSPWSFLTPISANSKCSSIASRPISYRAHLGESPFGCRKRGEQGPRTSRRHLPRIHSSLRFRQAYSHNLVTRHLLTPPQIEGSTALSQVYWHIVLPSDEHIIYSPEQLTAASQWQWLGSFWGRQPLKSQAELEQWVDASTQLAPADAQNQYLFTGLLPVSTIEVITAPRWLIVLIASTAALVLVLAHVYLPFARQTWVVAVAACAIAALAIIYPTAALLLAQAAAVGVVLAMLAIVLSRLFVATEAHAVSPDRISKFTTSDDPS